MGKKFQTTDAAPAVEEVVENTVEEAVEATPVVEEVKPEPTPAPAPAPQVETPVKAATNTDLKPGTRNVKIKETCKTTVNGTEIPEFAYKNTYVVRKVLADRIVIGVDMFTGFSLPVHDYDVVITK